MAFFNDLAKKTKELSQNSDFLTSKCFQFNEVDLRYFNLLILVNQKSNFEI